MIVALRIVASSILPCCVLVSCAVTIISHDEKAAASVAERFARAAFIEKDYSSAHRLLASEARQGLSVEQFADTVVKMHPSSLPTEIAATEFEPLAGQRAMTIYVKGTSTRDIFYYRMLMVGDQTSGYLVAAFWRGSGPYPPSKRQLLS